MCPSIGADTHHFVLFHHDVVVVSAAYRLQYHFHRLRCHPIALLHLLNHPLLPPLHLYRNGNIYAASCRWRHSGSGSVVLMSPYDLRLLLSIEAGSVCAKCHIFRQQLAGILVMI